MVAILGMILSLAISLLGAAVKIIFKLRLWPGLVYIAIAGTFFWDWVKAEEQNFLTGLYIVLGLCVLSWFSPVFKSAWKAADRQRRQKAILKTRMATIAAQKHAAAQAAQKAKAEQETSGFCENFTDEELAEAYSTPLPYPLPF